MALSSNVMNSAVLKGPRRRAVCSAALVPSNAYLGRLEAVAGIVAGPGDDEEAQAAIDVNRRGGRTGPLSGEAPKLQEVVGGADQLPFAVDGRQSASCQAADLAVVLDLREHRLDRGGSLLVEGAPFGRVDLGD